MENISHAGCVKVNSYLFLMRTDLGTGQRVKPYVCAGGGGYTLRKPARCITRRASRHISLCTQVVVQPLFFG